MSLYIAIAAFVGLSVGCCLGILVAGLCYTAKDD
jgi:hypothetical protein